MCRKQADQNKKLTCLYKVIGKCLICETSADETTDRRALLTDMTYSYVIVKTINMKIILKRETGHFPIRATKLASNNFSKKNHCAVASGSYDVSVHDSTSDPTAHSSWSKEKLLLVVVAVPLMACILAAVARSNSPSVGKGIDILF